MTWAAAGTVGSGLRVRAEARLGAAARSARSTSRTVGRGARTLLSPSGVRGAAVEVAWLGAHVVLYPLGLVDPAGLLGPWGRERRADDGPYRVEHLPPGRRGLVVGDVEAAGTPILLVHGLVDNRSIFTWLRRGLLRKGFGRVHSMNYSPLTADVRTAARVLGEQVEALAARAGHERIHVVGHSLGGLIARYYVQRLGGDAWVHTLVTLGSPHGGTLPAHLLPAELCRQLRPGSSLLAELAEPSPGCRTRFVAYWSDLDHMIVPQRNGRIVHPDLAVTNVLIRGVGHMSLPIDPRVVHAISTELAQLDAGDRLVAAGAAR